MDIFLHLLVNAAILYEYTVKMGVAAQESSQMHKKMACVQFIEEVSLIANCKPSELKLALTIIAELTYSETRQDADEVIFYSTE